MFTQKSRPLVKKHAVWQQGQLPQRGSDTESLPLSSSQVGLGPHTRRHTYPRHQPALEGPGGHSLHLNELISLTGQFVNKSPFFLRVPMELMSRPGDWKEIPPRKGRSQLLFRNKFLSV